MNPFTGFADRNWASATQACLEALLEPRQAAHHLLQIAALAEFLHHFLHLAMLLQQAVYILDGQPAARCNAFLPRTVNRT